MPKSNYINFIIPFFIINIFFLFKDTSRDYEITFLLILLLIIICFSINKHFQSDSSIGISSFIVFNYLFFYIAPIIQIQNLSVQNYTLINTLPFDKNLALKALFSIIIFNVLFFYFYYKFKKKIIQKKETINLIDSDKLKKIILFLLILSIFIVPLLFFYNENTGFEDSKPIQMFFKKFIFFIPVLPALYYVRYKNQTAFLLLLISILLIVFFKNPFFEKRNALGPIYLTLLTFFFPSFEKSNIKSFILILLSLLVIFPLLTIITHTQGLQEKYGLNYAIYSNFNLKEIFFDTFNRLHYDSFSNLMASIHYFYENGIIYGNQLLGSILFFFPRVFWIEKPLPSGMEIGNYLIDNHAMWFNIISMPIVGEGWLNFGILGVILFAIILAFLLVYFEKWIESPDFLKKVVGIYFSFHMIYILRGDLMTAIAFFIGPSLAFYILPKFLNNFVKSKNL